MSTKKNTLTKKQKQFIEAYEKNATNISRTCKSLGIDRMTYYRWREANATFKSQCDAIEEGMIDFAESMLYRQIKDGNTSAIIFFMKTKARKRGYAERVEVEHSGSIDIESTVLNGLDNNG